MIIAVLKEPIPETRVSLLPESIPALIKAGHEIWVEKNAGALAFAPDEAYAAAGATLVERNAVADAHIALSIHPAFDTTRAGQVWIGQYQPLYNLAKVDQWARQGLTIFSLDMLPRTTRAQSMDILSSQANIAGYKAVLLAASMYCRYMPLFMTAAGSVAPAKLLVLGAGVAGLQAVATARRLGAVVEVFDTRPAVKEEVMSLGARFVEVEGAADASKAGGYAVEQSEEFKQRQSEAIAAAVKKSDIVITTAQLFGKQAPLLISTAMIESMRPGSVIIDLAAATGGNTSLTKNNETVSHRGVTIVGDSALAASMPSDASKLYGKNLLNFLALIVSKEGALHLNWDDDLVKGACITHDHQLVHERVKPVTA